MSKPRILLVEDDNINAFIVTKFLKEDFEVVHADTMALALALFSAMEIDLILMDINLGPEMMGGIDVLRQIRETEKDIPVPAIALTAYAAVGDRERFIAEGFNDYISKPFDKRRLIRNIRDMINHSHSL